jgi:hypothetical protein
MGIGAGIFLIALGAILTFATNWKVSGLDLHAVGWVLMIVGVLGLVLFFTFWNDRRRRASSRAVVTERPVVNGPVATQRTTYVDDPTAPPPPGY